MWSLLFCFCFGLCSAAARCTRSEPAIQHVLKHCRLRSCILPIQCRFGFFMSAATCNLHCSLQHRTQQRCHRNMQHAHHSTGARSKQQLRGHFYKQLQSGAIVYISSCSCRRGGSKDNASHHARGSVSYIKLHRTALRPQGAAYFIATALPPAHEGCR